ncbi:GINS complex Psf3 component [Sparassis latifolia]|uniref:DNA replication complex GINS protein PSF3 n=1 Tax=Sparassis crispa TaxID=139825 RepID=A0A401GAE1_9APHY|nr:DNA replication complex GINS protein [Sparassis crispa]GBE79156.1 DNA replication complex GINS protein [Sparassis crispa]
MDDDYYSVESILAENQKVQCTFKVDIPDMGHLDGGNERDIKALSKAQIPMWMAYILIYSDHADFTIPPPFSSRVRNALKAEPCSVRLASLVGQAGMWYGFGRMIMRLLDDMSAQEISNVLVKTFQARLSEIVDQAQHFASIHAAAAASEGSGAIRIGGDTVTIGFREGLDVTERELFVLAQESARRMKRWYESSEKGRR